MSTTPKFTRRRDRQSAIRRAVTGAKHYIRLTLISGPRVLLTSRISGKCALIMILMSMPSLLCCFMLTVPGFIFQSPHQQAYFYFSRVLNEDPTRWIVLFLAGVCTLISLAVPATIRAPHAPVRY